MFDTATNQVVKTFPAPAQTMSFAFSPDGKRIYAFCVGQDILVLDSDDGHRAGHDPARPSEYHGHPRDLRPAASG